MKRFLLLILPSLVIFGTLLAGCAAPSNEELAKTVLAADPQFEAILTKKRGTDAKIGDLQNQLFAKKSEYDQQIRELQAAYRRERDALHQQMDDLISQLDPDREQLRLELTGVESQLKSREDERRSLQRAVQELRKSQGRSGQIDELTKQLTEAERAVQDLTAQRRLLRAQLRLLRQGRS